MGIKVGYVSYENQFKHPEMINQPLAPKLVLRTARTEVCTEGNGSPWWLGW